MRMRTRHSTCIHTRYKQKKIRVASCHAPCATDWTLRRSNRSYKFKRRLLDTSFTFGACWFWAKLESASHWGCRWSRRKGHAVSSVVPVSESAFLVRFGRRWCPWRRRSFLLSHPQHSEFLHGLLGCFFEKIEMSTRWIGDFSVWTTWLLVLQIFTDTAFREDGKTKSWHAERLSFPLQMVAPTSAFSRAVKLVAAVARSGLSGFASGMGAHCWWQSSPQDKNDTCIHLHRYV